jgi:hypothetical protein
MRLLFRGHLAYAHQVHRRYYEKDSRYRATTRRFLIAVGRIGKSIAIFFLTSPRYGAQNEEVTVTNVGDSIQTSFRLMNCAHCDNELIAPDGTEYRTERRVHHVWRYWKCDCCFETIVDTEVREDPMTRDEIFPSRLVE